MASLNRATLIGHLGKDPEVRVAQDGSKIVTLAVATSESWTDRTTGEKKERTEWHRVVIFQPRLAESAEKILKKGQQILVEGQIQSRKWTDSENREHRTHEIIIRYKGEFILLDTRRRDQENQQGNASLSSGSTTYSMEDRDEAPPHPLTDMEDSIPF